MKQRYSKFAAMIIVMAFTTFFLSANVFASGAGVDANNAFNGVMQFLVPWIQKLGGVVMLIGGIMFGLGFKNDDADSKTRGVQTLVAGAIVIAVGAGYQTFIGT